MTFTGRGGGFRRVAGLFTTKRSPISPSRKTSSVTGQKPGSDDGCAPGSACSEERQGQTRWSGSNRAFRAARMGRRDHQGRLNDKFVQGRGEAAPDSEDEAVAESPRGSQLEPRGLPTRKGAIGKKRDEPALQAPDELMRAEKSPPLAPSFLAKRTTTIGTILEGTTLPRRARSGEGAPGQQGGAGGAGGRGRSATDGSFRPRAEDFPIYRSTRLSARDVRAARPTARRKGFLPSGRVERVERVERVGERPRAVRAGRLSVGASDGPAHDDLAGRVSPMPSPSGSTRWIATVARYLCGSGGDRARRGRLSGDLQLAQSQMPPPFAPTARAGRPSQRVRFRFSGGRVA